MSVLQRDLDGVRVRRRSSESDGNGLAGTDCTGLRLPQRRAAGDLNQDNIVDRVRVTNDHIDEAVGLTGCHARGSRNIDRRRLVLGDLTGRTLALGLSPRVGNRLRLGLRLGLSVDTELQRLLQLNRLTLDPRLDLAETTHLVGCLGLSSCHGGADGSCTGLRSVLVAPRLRHGFCLCIGLGADTTLERPVGERLDVDDVLPAELGLGAVEANRVGAVAVARLVACLDPLASALDELHPLGTRRRGTGGTDVVVPLANLTRTGNTRVDELATALEAEAGSAVRHLRVAGDELATTALLGTLELHSTRHEVAGEDLPLGTDGSDAAGRLLGVRRRGLDVGTRSTGRGSVGIVAGR